jgi:hypothetical protein
VALRIHQRLMSHLISKFPWIKKKTVLPLSGGVVALTAVTALAFSYGPMFSAEPESASLSGGTSTVSDTNASGGQSIRFGPDGGIPTVGDFPTPSSVGPAVDPTIAYSGDCYFDSSQSNEVIDSRIIDCDDEGGLRFAADVTGIIFRNSIIEGQMFTIGGTPGDAGADTYPRTPVFTVEDSDIIQLSTVDNQDRALCCSHYVVKRSFVQGTHSALAVHNNGVLEGNYITTNGTSTHQSGGRLLKNAVFRGNTITCMAVPGYGPDGGCSAAGVFYSEDLAGQSAAAFNLTIENNYFKRPAGDGPYNATRFINCANRTDCLDITFTGNLFDLGWMTDGDEFPLAYGGNQWSGNYWTDGVPAESGQSR